MIPHENLIKTKEYWLLHIQNDMHAILDDYMQDYNLTLKQAAEALNINQNELQKIHDGEFDGNIEEMIDFSLKVDKLPDVNFKTESQYFNELKEWYNELQNKRNT